MTSLPFLLRLIAATILAQQNKALLAELAFTRAQLDKALEDLGPKHRFRFSDFWRMRLARCGEAVGWSRLAIIARVAKADTIRGWHRLMKQGRLGLRRVRSGRPRTPAEVESLIVRMAKENSGWGQHRIKGELHKLGIRISPRTIGAILKRHGLTPAPQRSADWTWRRFVTEKADALVATDFLTVEVGAWLWKRTYDVLFAVHLKTRQVKVLGVTDHANQGFMVQVAKNETQEEGWLRQMGCRYLIHDRDTKFCMAFQGTLERAGITPVPIPANSPNCNAFAERWVRTVKRECLRRLWFLDYGGLCRVLQEYADLHYNLERPHQGRSNLTLPEACRQARPPPQIPIREFKADSVRCVTRCRGAVRHYYRGAA